MHFIDENFWVAVSFIIFLYFAYRPVKKAIINSLDSKINEIKENLSQAEKLKMEAKFLLDEVQKEVDNFDEYKKQVIDSAKLSTERLIATRMKEMEITLSRKNESAIKILENEKAKVANNLKKEFADIVIKNIRNYLLESDNNSVSDEEIMTRLTKNSSSQTS